jgi:hypothetical protein
MHLEGTVDEDDLANLALYADGKEVAADLVVNSDDEIVAYVNLEMAADSKVKFELKGTVTGSVAKTIDVTFTSADDIYAVGATSGMPVALETTIDNSTDVNISDVRNIEGSEINVSFDKSDIDEAKPNAEDVMVGTLKITALSDDYTINKLKVTATPTGTSSADNVIDDLQLGGTSFDSRVGNEYFFNDIDLSSEEALSLDLVMDVKDTTTIIGSKVTFKVEFVEVEDDVNDVTYTDESTPSLSKVLSTTSFTNNTIEIKTAGVTFSNTKVNDRSLVLGNAIETVVYKGKLNVSDADSIVIKDFDLTQVGTVLNTASAIVDLDKIIADATLNIGGQTFDGDVKSNGIEFSYVNAEVAAGSDNVEIVVTVTLKENDAVAANQSLVLQVSSADLEVEDADGDTVTPTVTSLNSNPTTTTLRSEGTFAVKLKFDAQTDDNLENTVLAGTTGVTLAELDMEAEYEDMKVENLVFTLDGTVDHSNTIASAKLVNGSKVIADGAIITYVDSATKITFKNQFTVLDADDLQKAELVVDLNAITGKGDETTATAGTLKVATVSVADADVTGVSSNNDMRQVATTLPQTLFITNVMTESVAVVPTKLTFAVVETFANGDAKVKVVADSGKNTIGTNNQTPEVKLTKFTIVETGNDTAAYSMYKDGATGVGAPTAA